jgi:hypothetical protein
MTRALNHSDAIFTAIGRIPAQGLAYARRVPDAFGRVSALAAVVPNLPKVLREQAVEEALAEIRCRTWTFKETSITDALSGIACYVPERLIQDVLPAARAIGNESDLAAAIVAVEAHLPDPLRQQASRKL